MYASLAEVLQMLPDPQAIFSSLDTSLDTPYSKVYSDTNMAASGQDFSGIVSDRRAQLGDINTIIGRTQTILDQLHEKRKQIIFSMQMHEGFLSCIRRLPSDILSEIFLQCLPEAHTTPNTRNAPMLLTRICRGWREVALKTPRLWCSLFVSPPRMSGPSVGTDQQILVYHDWLKKAKGCPLSLKVSAINSMWNQRWRDAAVEFVRRYASRLVNFDVDFEVADDLCRLLGDNPILEHLCLSGSIKEFLEKEQTLSIAQPHPRLRTLFIVSPAFETGILSVVNLGWTNLTRLMVLLQSQPSDVADDMFLTLLQMCLNLEHFVFCPFRHVEDNDTVSFIHPKLRVLDITVRETHDSHLDSLKFPNLRRLQVRDWPSFETTSMAEHPFLDVSRNRIFGMTITRRSDCPTSAFFAVFNTGWKDLTHVRLEIHDYGRGSIILKLLRLCPNLEVLVTSLGRYTRPYDTLPGVTHSTLRSLAIHIQDSDIDLLLDRLTLPSLRHLDLAFPDWRHARFKGWLSVSHCPLETLKIDGPRISIEQREELVALLPSLRRLDLTESLGDEMTYYSWTR